MAAAQHIQATPGPEVTTPQVHPIRRSLRCLALLLGFALPLPACAEKPIDARTAGVLEFIGALEAPEGYDSYSGYAAAPPPKPLTTMTVAEVLDWQEHIDARSRSEAAGRFQIMQDTLRGYLVPTMGLTGREKFSPEMQNAMAVALMRRRGWDPESRDLVAMGNALALEWAALPLLSGPRAGQSAHRNVKGVRNRALTTPEVFLAVLRNPEQQNVVMNAVRQSRGSGASSVTRLAGARVRRAGEIRHSSVRPCSPDTLTGGALSPSRVLTFRSKPVMETCRSATRPHSPDSISGGPLTPSRIITFRIDPYAQNQETEQ